MVSRRVMGWHVGLLLSAGLLPVPSWSTNGLSQSMEVQCSLHYPSSETIVPTPSSAQEPCVLAEFGATLHGFQTAAATDMPSRPDFNLTLARPLGACPGEGAARTEGLLWEQGARQGLVVQRGGCSFVEKARLGHVRGFDAVFVANTATPGDAFPMAGEASDLNELLVVMISNATLGRIVRSVELGLGQVVLRVGHPVAPTAVTTTKATTPMVPSSTGPESGGRTHWTIHDAVCSPGNSSWVHGNSKKVELLKALVAHHATHASDPAARAVLGELYQCATDKLCSDADPRSLGTGRGHPWCGIVAINHGAVLWQSLKFESARETWERVLSATPQGIPAQGSSLVRTLGRHNLALALGPSASIPAHVEVLGVLTAGVSPHTEAWALQRIAGSALMSSGSGDNGGAAMGEEDALHALRAHTALLAMFQAGNSMGSDSSSLAMAITEWYLMLRLVDWQRLDHQANHVRGQLTHLLNSNEGPNAGGHTCSTLPASSRRALAAVCSLFIPGMDVPLPMIHTMCDCRRHMELDSDDTLPVAKATVTAVESQRVRDFSSVKEREQRPRIAYMSPNLRANHPVGKQLLPLLKAHNSTRVHVTCIAIGAASRSSGVVGGGTDPGPLVEQCESVLRLSYDPSEGGDDAAPAAEMARRIKAHGVDVLVDVSGHTQSGFTVRILLEKPASVVVHFHDTPTPYSSGYGLAIPGVDYMLSDVTSVGAVEEWNRNSSEKLMAIPHEFWVQRRWREGEAVQHGAQRATTSEHDGGDSSGWSVDGDLCNLGRWEKLSPTLVTIWANLLRTHPMRRLVLLVPRAGGERNTTGSPAAPAQQRLEAEFASRGIHPRRLAFIPHMAPAELHGNLSQRCALYLDTLEYNSISVAADAVRAGVNVLTLEGRTHQSRMAASIVRARRLGTGMSDCGDVSGHLVVQQLKEYEDAAARATTPWSIVVLRARRWLQWRWRLRQRGKSGVNHDPGSERGGHGSLFNLQRVAGWLESAAVYASLELLVRGGAAGDDGVGGGDDDSAGGAPMHFVLPRAGPVVEAQRSTVDEGYESRRGWWGEGEGGDLECESERGAWTHRAGGA